MTASQLIFELARLGIRLEVQGDRLRYSPKSAVTPALAQRMKAHKAGLLAILRQMTETPSIDPGEPLAAAEAQCVGDGKPDQDDQLSSEFDPPAPCPQCGTLELWQTLAGNWRCLRCDPPTVARRLRERIAQTDKRTNRSRNTGHIDQY